MRIRKLCLLICYLAFFCGVTITAKSEETPNGSIVARLSPDEIENQIKMDREVNPLYKSKLLAPLHEWKSRVAENTGFNWSLDYSALFLGVSGSPSEDQASSGMVRFFGFWDLVNKGEANKGSLNWKVENPHRYSDKPHPMT